MNGGHRAWTLALVGLLAVGCQAGDEALPEVYASQPTDVSLLQLIATPGDYSGRVVRVIGFCHLEFEGNGLYLHREDFERAILKNAVWLEVGQAKQDMSDQYVLVEATFDARDTGHMGMFAGSLRSVTRIERWLGRTEFERRR